MNLTVTIYLVTKNRLELLQRAIKSVEEQTFRDFELIVVDDGSDDGTAGFLATYQADFPFRFVSNPKSIGAPASRNRAIEMAEGVFITGLDDDDRFMPNRLERFVNDWQPGISLLASESILVTDNGKKRWRKPSIIRFEDLLYRNLIGNQVFTRTEYIRSVGGFDTALEAAQDYDLWLRLVFAYGVARIVPEPLQKITMHSNADRITSNLTENWGYYNCYLKYKAQMNRHQRRYHLFSIRRSRGKHYGLMSSLMHTPYRFWLKEFGHWWTSIK
ncbi:MAG: glycosyltransferase [Balneolales bacterium]|nr:glycosyltransferase [Balneolales bacterium]